MSDTRRLLSTSMGMAILLAVLVIPGRPSRAQQGPRPRLVAAARAPAAPREVSDLGTKGSRRGTGYLARRLRSPRRRPFEDIMGRRRSVRLLRRAMRTGPPDERVAAAVALARMDAPGVKGDLLGALDGATEDEAIGFVLALGELERPHLRRFLEDIAGDQGVGRALLGREGAVPRRVRAAAALSLGLLGATADEALLKLVFHPESTPPDVFLAASLALSFTEDRPWSPSVRSRVRSITRIPWLRSGPRRALRLALAVRDRALEAPSLATPPQGGRVPTLAYAPTARLRPALRSIRALVGTADAARLEEISWDLARQMGSSRDLDVLLDRLESQEVPRGPRRLAGLTVLGKIFDADPEAGLIRVRRAILLDAPDSPLVPFLAAF